LEVGVIIFDLVRFLPIKTIKLKFSKIKKIKTGSNRPVSVQFDYFILKTKTQLTSFGSVWFGFGAVWFQFGLIILY
jgi:hypothetical protein